MNGALIVTIVGGAIIAFIVIATIMESRLGK